MTAAWSSKRRRIVSQLMTGACAASVVAALLPLAYILFYIVTRGITALDWNFFTQLPKPTGETGGGMANAIVGSLRLIALASAAAVPLGVIGGIHVAEYPGGRLATAVRFCADVLNGIPSIVIGIFAYGMIVLPMRRFSALAGAAALAIMMIPIIVRSTEERGRARVTFTVVVPAALSGIITGILVAVSRIAGETAPLLFTAFNNQFWSTGVDQPTASLTVQIYSYAISPYEDLHRQAWAGALVLVAMILLFSALARLFTRRLERMKGA